MPESAGGFQHKNGGTQHVTLMNPKSTRVPWQKNTYTCHNCKTEFAADGRGKPLYCPNCAKKRRKHQNNQASKQAYHNKKNRTKQDVKSKVSVESKAVCFFTPTLFFKAGVFLLLHNLNNKSAILLTEAKTE